MRVFGESMQSLYLYLPGSPMRGQTASTLAGKHRKVEIRARSRNACGGTEHRLSDKRLDVGH